MIRVVQFSGGKDSTALVLWAREHFGDAFLPLFCDTGWEHPLTLAYVEHINQTVLGGRLVTVRSAKYADMVDLVTRKGRVPSVKARFCTEELKVLPARDYLRTLADAPVVYQGVRAAESKPRHDAGPRVWSDVYEELRPRIRKQFRRLPLQIRHRAGCDMEWPVAEQRQRGAAVTAPIFAFKQRNCPLQNCF